LDKRIVITAAISLAIGALVGAGITALSRDDSLLGAGPSSGPTLARYSGRNLTLGEAESELRAPGSQISSGVLSTPEGKKGFVEGLVRVDLLARLAEEKGYHRDPAFTRRVKQELAALYLRKEFEEPERKKAPTDAEIAKYFEENRAKLQRPERLRLAVIVFRAEDDAARRAKRPLAERALAEVRRRSGDYYAFGELAAARSEERPAPLPAASCHRCRERSWRRASGRRWRRPPSRWRGSPGRSSMASSRGSGGCSS
jgi:hypothetical protein